ncbi:unnamed protein product [Vitrella brassicaformis CCMP3155]|uniref:Transmembrane protein 231 n=1 Tax=Vitrella brassicaformis (strain CCMP3155) TaxID=1169540 RepID=A0A0G4FCA7_VITBC|nr:unnamed protein product [Vitrella brassicaformis CCMP3155]|mmetsp:Transcript_49286/g.123528  ORF Transcript_49286/g.123528 Transcript_49286/m.123528 type:complete len:349 (-) Transcript_49286:2435-3481(-)|eukprot:CEM10828.1 unnamed protein product [Vitrella brassicaformis CCMP3155]
MAIAHSTPSRVAYVTPIASLGCLLSVALTIGVIIVPFLIAFSSYSFWLHEGSYTEQPEVAYSSDALALIEGRKNGLPSTVFWSTVQQLNQLAGTSVVTPDVRVRAADFNLDGKTDRLTVEMTFPLSTQGMEEVDSVMLMLGVTYRLNDRVRMDMQGLAVLAASTAQGRASLSAKGAIRLVQRNPLPVGSKPRRVYDSSPLSISAISPSSSQDAYAAPTHALPFVVRRLLDSYTNRNESISFDLNSPPFWSNEPATTNGAAPMVRRMDGQASGGSVYQGFQTSGSKSFRATVVMEVPEQPVRYRPDALELLKFAWIQCLAFLVPLWYIVGKIKDVLFGKILPSRAVVMQ